MAQYDLDRFLKAQENVYPAAVNEMAVGKKTGHWMWFIFPQLKGLGHSAMAEQYGIQNLEEATAYLADEVLGNRLKNITTTLLAQPENDPHAIFGSPDDMKLRSCLTLFAAVPYAPPMFEQALQKFYGGRPDERTLRMLGR